MIEAFVAMRFQWIQILSIKSIHFVKWMRKLWINRHSTFRIIHNHTKGITIFHFVDYHVMLSNHKSLVKHISRQTSINWIFLNEITHGFVCVCTALINIIGRLTRIYVVNREFWVFGLHRCHYKWLMKGSIYEPYYG